MIDKDVLKNIVNTDKDETILTATVSSLSPLQVKFYGGDNAINVKAAKDISSLLVGSNVVIVRYMSKFIIIGVIGSVIPLVVPTPPYVPPAYDFDMDCIQVNLNSAQLVTTTSPTKVQFATQKVIVGSKLSLSSYGIVIGTGVSTVEVNLTLWLEVTPLNSYTALYIYKNGTVATYMLFPSRATNANFQAWRGMHDNIILDVVKGDIIYGYVKFAVANAANAVKGSYTNSCNMNVKVLAS